MKHYKVVKESGEGFISAVVMGHAITRYTTDEWAKAPERFAKHGYHLLVFTQLREAANYARLVCTGISPAVIFEARVRGIVPLPLYRYDIDVVGIETIPYMKKHCETWLWPDHTRMAKEVILTRRIASFSIGQSAGQFG